MPALLAEGRKNLTRPVALYARLAIESARQMDGLFKDSLMTLAGDLSAAEHDAARRGAGSGALAR